MSSAESTLSNLKQLNQAVTGEAKVILTSRTHYFRDKDEVDRVLKKEGIQGISHHASMLLREISGKSEYEIIHLKEFSDSQVREYLEKAIGDDWKSADKKIRSIYNLHDLSYRPVLLDMIVKTLPRIEKGAKEFNVVHLYEVYTQFWFDREDHRLKITKEGKEALVEGLAYKLWEEEKTSIHYKALSGIISEHLKEKINTLRDLEAADYEVRTASFLVRDEGGNYSFAHRSFQEFFIARKIKKELLRENVDILNLRLLSKEIVFFLAHLMENHHHTLQLAARLLEAGYREKISENALFIFYTVLKMEFFRLHFSLKEDIKFFTGDVEAFKEKVQSYLLKGLHLATALLSGWTLPHMVFKQSDLSAAFMEDAVFTDATFEDVVFNGTRMKGSDFSGSIFRNVRFEKAAAHHCNFRNCRFENCLVKGSDFSMSNFITVVFEACIIEDNDFVGTGFYRSNFKKEEHKNNYYFAVGVSGTELSGLSPVLVNQGHRDSVNAVVISKDGRFTVSGSSDETLKMWDVETGRLIKSFTGHEAGVNSVFLSPDSRWIVSGSDDETVKLWEVETGSFIKSFTGHESRVNSVFLSPDNWWIISGSSDKTVKLWEVETGRLIKTFTVPEFWVNSVFLSPDNRWMVSGCDDGTVKLWDAETGHLIKTFTEYENIVKSVFLSPDNWWIVSGSDDETVKLWEVETGYFIKTFAGHESGANSVFLSPDNRWMVLGSDGETVELWEIETDRLIKTFAGHKSTVRSVFFSPDSRWMV
jgi:WD40 repeat protein